MHADAPPPRAAAPAKITVEGIGKSFAAERGELHVLDEISLEVRDGETVAIVGPSGCGKSTLMGIVAGFQRPDRGSVKIDGAALTGPGRGGARCPRRGRASPGRPGQETLRLGVQGRRVG